MDQGAADAAVAALVRSLGAIEHGRPSRQVPLPGHYASVIRLDERIGIALSTDSVGTKMVVAEQLGRFDTVGIDCVAMNVNDVICVGAEPMAMLDYIATERADPEICGAARGRAGARRGARRGRDPRRRDRPARRHRARPRRSAARASGTVALDAIVAGAAVEPGDPVIGLPSRASTRTATRSRARRSPASPLDDDRLGRPLGDVLLEPTEIYVRPSSSCSLPGRGPRPRPHHPGGLDNLLRLAAEVGYEIDDPLPVPPVFGLIQELGAVSDAEMYEVFNMGCGFCCVVAAADEGAALELLRRHYPEAKRIGRAAEGPRQVRCGG